MIRIRTIVEYCDTPRYSEAERITYGSAPQFAWTVLEILEGHGIMAVRY